ncbi:hypothetical protein A5757_19280 [Mycobacterium sp. 852013-51886_SCH5428379]|uniref:hypothetical protein n=1 Tax=Mycobacterium sp. 852013-51886_SCH5428379 TaxID=1834111 RepID=UPI000800FA08|nr:hypothetical protein [Mycobacterium sp. 852013-51886_SCH5428379]OBB57960.1 hypothetical protein A5757_19280 [Mycobacterium sp. 852013-51886_SCH5428379]
MRVTVYRAPARNAHGDPVDQDGHPIRVGGNGTNVGDIDGAILGGQSVERVSTRGDVVSTEGLIGVPVAAIALEIGDTLIAEDGTRLKVSGPALWGRPHSLTGAPARYRWHQVGALHN